MARQYLMSKEELRAVQLIELELLCELDRICKEHDIKYRIAAGTLLGAVRHGGFIPWDDDADVHFKRDEYEKFREACKNALNLNKFYFQDLQTTPGYRWGYGKLRRKNTLFLRSEQEHMPYEQGIFIDLFIDDYVPDNYFARCMCAIQCFLYRKALWSEVGKKTSTGIVRLIYIILSKIPEKIIKERYVNFTEKRRKKTGWVRTLTFPAPTKDYGYPSKWWDKFCEVEFEGFNFLTFYDKEDYLKFKYGDYMSLPPENKRKIHSISKLKMPKECE